MSSNLSFSNSTAKRYALALYELSKENSELKNIEEEVKNLRNLLVSSVDFRKMIMNPIIKKNEQLKTLEKISNYLNFSKTLKKFLGLLTFNRKLFFLNKIIDSFFKIVSSNKGELSAQLMSSKKLTDAEINSIQKDLSEYLGKILEIKYTHVPNLIGGFKLQLGSTMIDTSIKSKLKRLEKLMIEA